MVWGTGSPEKHAPEVARGGRGPREIRPPRRHEPTCAGAPASSFVGRLVPLFALIALASNSGCFVGAAGVAAGLGGGGGGGGGGGIEDEAPPPPPPPVNTDPTILPASLRVTGTQAAPAVIELVLVDAESDPATLELIVQLPDYDDGTGTIITPSPTVLTASDLVAVDFVDADGVDRSASDAESALGDLTTSAPGTRHWLLWDFVHTIASLDPPLDPAVAPDALIESISIEARIVRSGRDPIEPSAQPQQSLTVAIGNDPPAIELDVSLLGEVDPDSGQITTSGIIAVPISFSDSSGDPLEITVEYIDLGDPACDWTLAAPADLLPGDDYEPPSLQVDATETIATEFFFWDTTSTIPSCSLSTRQTEVRLRVTARERLGPDDVASANVVVLDDVETFIVDNNEAPIIFLEEGSLLSNTDESGGLPIAFRIVDAESDPVRVVLQWRYAEQSFDDPLLDIFQNPSTVDEVLGSTELRARAQICEALEPVTALRAIPAPIPGGDRVRIPALADEASAIARAGLIGQTVEVLRPTGSFTPVTADWDTPLVDAIVDVVPIPDSPDAWILLDRPAMNRWALIRVDLSTGAARTIAGESERTGEGRPNGLAVQPESDRLWVASHDATTEMIHVTRMDLTDDLEVTLWSLPSATPLRRILPWRGTSLLACRESDLCRVDLVGPTLTPLVSLGEPVDIVRIPDEDESVWVVDRNAPGVGSGRIVRVDLRRNTTEPVAGLPLAALDDVRRLAVAQDGRLWSILTDASLHGVDRLRRPGMPGFEARSFPGDLRVAAIGTDHARIVANDSTIWVAGGLEQTRTVVDHAPATQTVVLDVPSHP
ncbi:MAG: hypothetical protein KDC38_17940, partial [Planctomycetes bacterium]|nr:hypothetical protein [Planctomycetota bacterium]